ncbi:hypothetical protein [Pseudomonas sp. 24 E 1]|nr:hypothetical protein [Pseudomonas sp. 24 E 1]CRM37634.1 hypothetical protein [Pseudomonas sp. 58 R 12]
MWERQRSLVFGCCPRQLTLLVHIDQSLQLHSSGIIRIRSSLERLPIKDLVKPRCAHAIECLDGNGGAVATFSGYDGGNGFVVSKLFTCHVAGPSQ